MKYQLSYKDYIKFINNFSHAISGGWYPDYSDWVNRVLCNHQHLYDRLGGLTKTFKVQLEEEYIVPDVSTIDKYYCIISKNLPHCIKEGKLQRKNFLYPFLSSENGCKWTGRLTKRLANGLQREPNISPKAAFEVQHAISELGKIFKNHQISKDKWFDLTISADPRMFLTLGTYGVDSGSCFRQSSCNPHHKSYLGIMPNSFIVVLSESMGENYSVPFPKDVLGRCFCLPSRYNDNLLHTLNFVNIYVRKNMNQSIMIGSMKKIYDILNKDKNIAVHKNCVTIENHTMWLYLNNEQYTLTPKDFVFKKVVITNKYDSNFPNKLIYCDNCRSYQDKKIGCNQNKECRK
ncbi:MAG: hypothetical protein BAJALOKI3v1_50023 [Promethearchaeota archaeon]|nr:MAG: hypothetical protein BAJALOKI3v1_50023 [Candidatus Lokiarchaeota archaeon]